ncbi:hypothetical protein ACFLZB_03170 [Nanoarchaeota archaeon]
MSVALEIIKRGWEIMTAPVADPSMLWEVLPLIVTTVLLTMYFSKHRDEKLGWNTAFANSFVLFFVGINLIRVLYVREMLGFNLQLLVVVLMMVVGVILAFLDFYHVIPENIAFLISSKLPLNYFAYIVVVYVHIGLILDWITLVAVLLMFVLLIFIIWLMETRPIKKINKSKNIYHKKRG